MGWDCDNKGGLEKMTGEEGVLRSDVEGVGLAG